MKVREIQDGLEVNGTRHAKVYANYVNCLTQPLNDIEEVRIELENCPTTRHGGAWGEKK
jgi:hypothetical protein